MGGMINAPGTERVGDVKACAVNAAPFGWLKANGAAISRAAYAALFAEVGTIYGAGDGATTFNLPDLRGEFLRGFDDARGADSGRVFGSNQNGQMPSHTHAVAYASTVGGGGTNPLPGPGGAVLSDATGGTENASENRPRNVALLFCIKY